MRIAVVDDEYIERNRLQEYLKKFSKETGIELNICSFSSGENLLHDYRLVYDIILLDIEMTGANGMDTAKQIRKIDKGVIIIFITNLAQYAIEGYNVEAIDYILKPVTYLDFSMKFRKAVRKVSQREDTTISVDTLDGLRVFSLSEIYYIEVLAHYLIYHTKSGEFKSRGSLKAAEARMIPYNFYRSHKCYIINLKYVTSVKTKEIIVGDTILPIGRVYKETFIQEYMKYIKG